MVWINVQLLEIKALWRHFLEIVFRQKMFISWQWICKCRLKNVGHFVGTPTCQCWVIESFCYGLLASRARSPSMANIIQYIPRNMHTVFALLCFGVVKHWLIFPYPSGLLHWHCGNLTIAPVPAKQPWWIWLNTSREFIMNDCITTTKQSTTKPCAYFLGYTVHMPTVGSIEV